MSTPDRRARDKDRDEAIELVEAAWADGQIVEADRDKRVEELLRAQTLSEVWMLTRDLQVPSTPAQAVPPEPVPPDAMPIVDFGELTTEPVRSQPEPVAPQGAARPRLVAGLVALALLGAGVGGVLSLGGSLADGLERGSSGNGDAGAESGPLVPPRLLDEDGYDDLVADVREVSGSTEAFEAVLYPEYAIVYLPVDEATGRQELWYWDGSIVGLDSSGTSTSRRFDLADVEPEVVVRLVERARRLVDGPTRSYAILRAPDAEGVAIYAYATNEYREGGFIAATASGRVVRNTFTR